MKRSLKEKCRLLQKCCVKDFLVRDYIYEISYPPSGCRCFIDTIWFHFLAEFAAYFEHIRSLRFEDRPDYDYLKRLFRELFFRKGFSYDNVFDWDAVGAFGVPPVADDMAQDLEKRGGNGVASTGADLERAQTSQAESFMAYRSGVGGVGAGTPSNPSASGGTPGPVAGGGTRVWATIFSNLVL